MVVAVVGVAVGQWYASVIASLYCGFAAGLIMNATGLTNAVDRRWHGLAERTFFGVWQVIFFASMCLVTLALYRLASWKRIGGFVFSTVRDRRLAAMMATTPLVILHAVMTMEAQRNTIGPLLFMMTGEMVTAAHP
jgi:hypothetical protein